MALVLIPDLNVLLSVANFLARIHSLSHLHASLRLSSRNHRLLSVLWNFNIRGFRLKFHAGGRDTFLIFVAVTQLLRT